VHGAGVGAPRGGEGLDGAGRRPGGVVEVSVAATRCWTCGRPSPNDLCIDCEWNPPNEPNGPPNSGARPRPATSSRPRPERAPVDPSTSSRDLVPEPHSWAVVDLVARAARPPEPPDVIGLFYPGYFHLLSGESEALKTWLALLAAAEELRAGRGVLWVDGDDVGAGAVLERLRLLGIEDAAITTLFAYILPDEPLDQDKLPDVLAVARDSACRLAVLDGFNPLLALHGLDPNSGTDVEMFYRLIDPIRKLGAATILTDNVVKSREARGTWAIGSERKKSKADVHLGMRKMEPLVRGGRGKAKIDVHKDRPGHLVRPSPGVLVLDSTSDAFVWKIEPDESRSAEGEFRPTNLMEKVSRFLELHHSEPQSYNQIETAKLGKAEYVRIAIGRLVEEGYATEFEGARNARLVQLERAFRESEESE
jgi:AAA domain